ncbi:MAG: T9SS type A sorting domain-containing protein [Bacteroidota bacterium]
MRLLFPVLLLLAAPIALAQTDLIVDGSFESGDTNPVWGISTSSGTTPICNDSCGRPARTGTWYAFLGGLGESNDMSVSQTVTIPADATSALLTYYLQLGAGGDGTGEFGLLVDGILFATYTQDDATSFQDYTVQNVDLSALADGQPHTITFVVVEIDGSQGNAFFAGLVDDVSLVVNTPPPPGGLINDFLFAAIPIVASPFVSADTSLAFSAIGANVEPDFNPSASCVGGSDGGNATWWMFAATGPGEVEVFAQGTGPDPMDTILTVLTLNSDGTLNEIACNDDRTADPDDGSRLTLTTTPGTRYFIRLTGFQGDEGEGLIGIGGLSGLSSTFLAGSPNDNLASAPGLLAYSRAPATYPDTNVGATEESGEPLAQCVNQSSDGRNSVWRLLTAPVNGVVTIDWEGSSFDTIASVHALTSNGGVGEQVACNDDVSVGVTTSRVTFPVTAGTQYVIRTVGFDGEEGSIRQAFSFEVSTSSETPAEMPGLQLATPYPNPSAGIVHLSADVPEAAEAHVEVFNALGQRVAVLHEGPVAAGEAEWTWDATEHPAGVYIVRLTAGGAVRAQTVTVTR